MSKTEERKILRSLKSVGLRAVKLDGHYIGLVPIRKRKGKK